MHQQDTYHISENEKNCSTTAANFPSLGYMDDVEWKHQQSVSTSDDGCRYNISEKKITKEYTQT